MENYAPKFEEIIKHFVDRKPRLNPLRSSGKTHRVSGMDTGIDLVEFRALNLYSGTRAV